MRWRKVVVEMLTGSRLTHLLPELDMDAFLRGYLEKHPYGLSADSVTMLATALAFDPLHRPKDVLLFAKPIVCDLGVS